MQQTVKAVLSSIILASACAVIQVKHYMYIAQPSKLFICGTHVHVEAACNDRFTSFEDQKLPNLVAITDLNVCYLNKSVVPD